LFLGALGAPAQGRIATVELTKVFDSYWKTKQSKAALADREADLKKDLDDMQESHKKLIQQYQKQVVDANDQAVSSEERDKRKKALEGKAKEVRESEETLKQMASRIRADLDTMAKRMMEQVLKDIRETVEAKGKAGGYTFVVDSSAKSLSNAEVFLYNAGDSDLTKAVIDQLNAAAPPEPAALEKKK
jgi:Skp family chaperone for outer membrane proteins